MTAYDTNSTWPFVEAKKLLRRIENQISSGARDKSQKVVFETGYCPSGLPHIGTFSEVVRTQMVRHAFHCLTDNEYETQLIVFSDDRDPFDKVPGNVPDPASMEQHVGKHMRAVPNPFSGTGFATFAEYNNDRLCRFLDEMNFPAELDYEFKSSHDAYNSGEFDSALNDLLANYNEIMAIILPTLGEARRTTWSPFFPILSNGNILKDVPATPDFDSRTLTCNGTTIPVDGKNVKCQWKVDWAMRWHALQVDYEMYGKDLMESYRLSSQICRELGSEPPVGMRFELFLDENGNKLSKSVGNGFDAASWSRFGPRESLVYYMFQKPTTAKKFSNDLIVRSIDDYCSALNRYEEGDAKNPVWHVHYGRVPAGQTVVPFTMVLNIASGAAVTDAETLHNLVFQQNPEADTAFMRQLVDYAFNYYRNFVAGTENFRTPDDTEQQMLLQLVDVLEANRDVDAKILQTEVYNVGRSFECWQDHAKPTDDGRPGVSRDFFKSVYQILLGQDSGPRFGAFAFAFGIDRTIALINERLGA